MKTSHSSENTIEYTIADTFLKQHVLKNTVHDISVILSLLSQIYSTHNFFPESVIHKRHISMVKKLIDLSQNKKTYFDMPMFVDHLTTLYKKYVSSLEIDLITDVPYSEDLKKTIGSFCQKTLNLDHYVMNEYIDPSYGGGFIVRFRDYRLDASYQRGINVL